VKHILKYLYLTRDDGLHYWRVQPNESLPAVAPPKINSNAHDILLDGQLIHDSLELHGFVDADWATCPKTCCFLTRVYIQLAGGRIAYKSKLQPMIAQSSTEAEFMGTSDYGRMILFACSILWDIGLPQEAATILYKDNNACIAMAMAQKPTLRTCHMDIKYHVLIGWIEHDPLQLEWIDTTLNMADHITKHLGNMLFHRHVNYILGKVPPTYSAVFKNFSQSINTAMKKLLPSPAICSAILPHKPHHHIAATAATLRATWSYILGSTH
jgi:hypothetical protein